MAINFDDPPLYDPLTRNGDYMSPIYQSWLATFFQTLIQKLIFWQVVKINTQMQITNGYIANGAAIVLLNLPLKSEVGDEIEVGAMNAAGWTITQNAGQFIQFGAAVTTIGLTGSLSSAAIGDTARIVCVVENQEWLVLSSQGALVVV